MNNIAIDILFSNSCNLSCSYCRIDSDPLERQKIISYIESEKWIEDIQKYCPNIEYLGFWGKESTLNLPLLKKSTLNSILEKFPKLKYISFSSNFVDTENLKVFVNNIPDSIEIGIQVSLDGDKNLSKFTRGESNFDQIIKNILDFSSFISNKNIKFWNRSTWNSDVLDFLSEKNNLINHYKFFSDLDKKINDITGNKKCSFKNTGNVLSRPYNDYAKEDGLNFAAVLQHILDLKETSYPYDNIISDIYRNNKNSWVDIFNSGCSSGKTNMGIFDGKIYPCHDIFLNKEPFLLFNDESEMKKNIRSIHSYHTLQLANDKMLANNLLNIDEVQESSCKNEYIYLMSMIAKSVCYLKLYSEKKSFYLNSIGTFRLFLNGAIERLMELHERK